MRAIVSSATPAALLPSTKELDVPMHLTLLKAKIHRATVTHSELNY